MRTRFDSVSGVTAGVTLQDQDGPACPLSYRLWKGEEVPGRENPVNHKLSRLSDIDPLAVPLPHGTEVKTRVERLAGERRVPQGAAGRVVGFEGGTIRVHVVGVGVLDYRRSELVPRKSGQLRFALRRELSWQALSPCVVLEAVVGSRAWGLSDADSDTDRRGVFALPFSWTTGLGSPPEDLVSADGSSTHCELGKALRQGLRADPNTLEMLFVPSVRALDELGQWILEARDAFVSREIYRSFGRYALSQLRRLEHSLRLAEQRDLLLDWLRRDPVPTLDEVAERMAEASRIDAPSPRQARLRAKEYIKAQYRSLYDQGLLEARDFESLVRFAREAAPSLDLPRDLRPKNAYNLIRLMATATHWLRSSEPDFEMKGPLRERLLAIKRGDVPLSSVLETAESMSAELESARQNTCLPAKPDVARVDTLLRRAREELARRHFHCEPGPFGREAPPCPEPEWGIDEEH